MQPADRLGDARKVMAHGTPPENMDTEEGGIVPKYNEANASGGMRNPMNNEAAMLGPMPLGERIAA